MDYDVALKIITEAHNRKYLGLDKQEDICLAAYINTANRILRVIEDGGVDGLDRSQIGARVKLADNTVNCYCRILSSLKYIFVTVEPVQGQPKIYRSIKYERQTA